MLSIWFADAEAGPIENNNMDWLPRSELYSSVGYVKHMLSLVLEQQEAQDAGRKRRPCCTHMLSTG